MEKFLFDDFEKLSPAAWKQKIQVDLKGADYNDSLLSKTNEGVLIKPFYTNEDRNHQSITLPQGSFRICQTVFVDDVSIANKLALNALERGANSIQFIAKKPFDIHQLIKDIQPSATLYFQLKFLNPEFVLKISSTCKDFQTFIQTDIIGNLAETGNWFSNFKKDVDDLKSYVENTHNSISVNASLYQNAGANIVQQLAYGLAHTNEYLEIFGDSVAHKIHYQFSVGSNYFFEIAKLRAFRILHSSLLKYRQIDVKQTHIFSQPSKRNKTIYDYNVNMLRTTSECMSAILGGSNTISNISYDAIYHKSNDFGERISRNQLLILKEEAYLKEAQSFPDGSYYIESITKQLVQKALELFKQIEKGGGYLSQLKKGTIQKKIAENAQKEQQQFDEKEIILLGTNKLPNQDDKMKDDLEIYPFLKKNISKTLVAPIIQTRLSESYEKQRLDKESL